MCAWEERFCYMYMPVNFFVVVHKGTALDVVDAP
jgi:hypothetical protein